MQYRYDFAGSRQPAELEDHYWLDDRRLSRAFCTGLPSRLADLLELVMAAYAADRMSRRDFKKVSTGLRRIHIRLGMREPEFWASNDILKGVCDLLNWLSEDVWSFEFVRRDAPPWPAEYEGFLFRQRPEWPPVVCLFSGGLDSLAGLAAQAHKEPAANFVLVSGYTNDRLAHQQRLQVERIKSIWRHDGPAKEGIPEIQHIAVPFGIRKSRVLREEKGQRTRALVFLTFGLVASVQAGSDTLWICENGIGALNLRLNETQLGADNYRGVHPLSLIMVRQLFEQVLGGEFRVNNPFLFYTKAELCGYLPLVRLATLIPETVSCDGFAQRVAAQPQCGYCTSCILRRQSLHAANLGRFDASAGYRYDLLSDQTELTLKRAYGLHAMLAQVETLKRCVSAEYPWQALIVAFPELVRVQAAIAMHHGLDQHEFAEKIVRMYRTYVKEWDGFPLNFRLAA